MMNGHSKIPPNATQAVIVECEVDKGIEDLEEVIKKEWRPKKVRLWLTKVCPCHFKRPEGGGDLVLQGKLLFFDHHGLMYVTLKEGREIEPNVTIYPFLCIKDTFVLFCWDSA
jgi:hypothetical protein